MKNANKWEIIRRIVMNITLIVIIGSSFAACDSSGGSGDGNDGETITFSLRAEDRANFTIEVDGAKWKDDISASSFNDMLIISGNYKYNYDPHTYNLDLSSYSILRITDTQIRFSKTYTLSSRDTLTGGMVEFSVYAPDITNFGINTTTGTVNDKYEIHPSRSTITLRI